MSNEINYAELYMKALGLSEEVIQKQNEGTILCSDSMEIVELHPELKNKLEELQEKYQDVLAFYHIIYTYLYGCPTMNFLYCSKNADEAEFDLEFLKKGIVRAYCWNLYIPEWSELGDICIKKINDTFVRIS